MQRLVPPTGNCPWPETIMGAKRKLEPDGPAILVRRGGGRAARRGGVGGGGSCGAAVTCGTRRFGRMSCWQPKLEPGPRLDQFEASVRVRSTFLTDFFLFLCRKFTFGGPETGSEKTRSTLASTTDIRTDLSSIRRLPGPTLRTRKRLYSRETAQKKDPDRTL